MSKAGCLTCCLPLLNQPLLAKVISQLRYVGSISRANPRLYSRYLLTARSSTPLLNTAILVNKNRHIVIVSDRLPRLEAGKR